MTQTVLRIILKKSRSPLAHCSIILLLLTLLFSITACGGDGGDGVTGGVTYYTVTFNSNGGTAVSPIAGLASGSTITAPTAPTKGSYGTFGGWYKDTGLTNVWNFVSDTVTSNITLYGKWNAAYSLGDTGLGGGKIFYRSETGFTLYMNATDST